MTMAYLLTLGYRSVLSAADGLTCAQEQHLVAAVGGHHLVRRHRRVPVGGVGPHQQRSAPQRVDGVEHERVVPHEGHHVVGELLGGLDVRREGSAGALRTRKGRGLGLTQEVLRSNYCLLKQPAKESQSSRFRAWGKECAPGTPPTGSWVPLGGRRVR